MSQNNNKIEYIKKFIKIIKLIMTSYKFKIKKEYYWML